MVPASRGPRTGLPEFPQALNVDSPAELATLLWDLDHPGLSGSERDDM